MTEKTIEKTIKITKPIKTYIAKDGKEFDSEDECLTYENDCFLSYCLGKYKIELIEVPTFICADRYTRGFSFYFPQDGDKNEVIKLLSIFQSYEIIKNNDKIKTYCIRYLGNVYNSDLEIEIPFELKKGENYIFYFSHEEESDTYDYFYNEVVSKEIAMDKLKKEIENFETLFATKFERMKEND